MSINKGKKENGKGSHEEATAAGNQFRAAAAAAWLRSCPALCDPADGSPRLPVPAILQARTPEWGAISFSKFRLRRP